MSSNIEDLSEEARAGIETLIETALHLREKIPFFLKLSGASIYKGARSDWSAVLEQLEIKSGNLYIPKEYVVNLNWDDGFLYTADQAKELARSLNPGESADLNFSNLEYQGEKLKGTFLYYADDLQIDALFEFQHLRIRDFLSKIGNISCKQDPRKPFKSICKAFNDFSKAEIGDRFFSDKEHQKFLFSLAAGDEVKHPDVLAYREVLYSAAFEAFQSYKIDSRELLYGAMSKILDTRGIDVTPGIVKLHIELLFTDDELCSFGKNMPRIQIQTEGIIKLGEIRASDIRFPSRLSEVYQEEVNRTGAGQYNASSLQGSPYPDVIKSGRQRFAFRKNFE